jgi:hypothetical protein
MKAGIAGEKRCEVCDCLFVNKDDANATRCKSCAGIGPEMAGPNEKFIYQDVKRSDVEAKLNLILAKLEVIRKMLDGEKSTQEYSKKCEVCGQVFVSGAPAAKYCDDCKAAGRTVKNPEAK